MTNTVSPAIQEEFNRLLFAHEASGGYLWEITPEGIYTYVSPEVLQVKGHPPQAFMGHSPFEFMPQEEVAEVRRIVQLAVENKSRFQLIHSDIAANGEILWEEVKGIVKVDQQGKVIGLYGSSVPINDRIRVERELREATAQRQADAARKDEQEHLHKIARLVPGMLYQFRLRPDGSSCVPYASDYIHQLYQVSPEQVREDASPLFARIHPDDLAALQASVLLSAGELSPWKHEFRVIQEDGSERWLSGESMPQREPNDATLWHGFVTDITERKQADEALRESENRFRLMFEKTADALLLLDPQNGQFIDCNQAAADMLGFEGERVKLPLRPDELSPTHQPDGRLSTEKAADMIATAMRNGSHRFEWMHCSAYRTDFPVEVLLTPVQIGQQQLIITTWRDITERKQAEAKLQLAANVFTHAHEGIFITDADGTIVEVNDIFTQITGYTREDAVGQNPRIFKSGKHAPEHYAAMWRDLIKNGFWVGEVWNRRKNGEVFAEMQTISAVYDANGKVQQYVALFTDITPMKNHEHQLERIAHYDALTSLPNRVLLADRLQQAMIQSERRNHALAVVYLDLDGFKAVNDSYGHETGDDLLIAVSKSMKEALRDGDTLARLGGDEFVAVLADLEQAQDCQAVLERLLHAATVPVTVNDLELRVSASIGVTIYPQDGVDADMLLRHADQAMYQAKQAGKNRYHLFDLQHDAAIKTQRESLEHICRALDRHEFVLYYQPKVNMQTGAVIGAEALIRWQHPERGLLSPAAFLPIIENHPISVQLGEWVIDTALAQVSQWRIAGLDIPVSVNVGARQLQQQDFVSQLSSLLARYPSLEPACLELEILETSALEDMAEVYDNIHACREMGVRFALDDFGTGYSSLTYLKRLPADMLKIDQSFVRDMLEDQDDLAIVQGVIGLATAFRRQVIAEGVETVAHGTRLLSLGCVQAQGYGIARPMPAGDLAGWVADWKPDAAWAS